MDRELLARDHEEVGGLLAHGVLEQHAVRIDQLLDGARRERLRVADLGVARVELTDLGSENVAALLHLQERAPEGSNTHGI
jgi:hypothetical protein